MSASLNFLFFPPYIIFFLSFLLSLLPPTNPIPRPFLTAAGRPCLARLRSPLCCSLLAAARHCSPPALVLLATGPRSLPAPCCSPRGPHPPPPLRRRSRDPTHSSAEPWAVLALLMPYAAGPRAPLTFVRRSSAPPASRRPPLRAGAAPLASAPAQRRCPGSSRSG
jgi:hypothetical protein